VDEILRMLEEGIDRSEIAEKLGYKNPMPLDNYMRRRNFSWDSRQKMFVPAAERYSAKLHNNILPLYGTSKAALIIANFVQDGADAKEIAR
jgi:DNA-binding NarL/FixJ family response regulator